MTKPTAADRAHSDELRGLLAEALRRAAPTASIGTGYERIADALLPVVTAWVAEKTARQPKEQK